jgi:DNA-binding NarL/FixJ family response regulator
VKLVLADDHALFRAGLRSLLATFPGIGVVAEASTGEEAVSEVLHHQADALVLDVEMPGQTVFTTVAAVLRARPSTQVVILTMHQDDALRRDLLKRGVHAYLSKTDPVDAVVEALQRRRSPPLLGDVSDIPLSDRELQVLALVGAALTNQQVAMRLGLATGTVKRHLANISDKLGAVSRLDAVRRARFLGLL